MPLRETQLTSEAQLERYPITTDVYHQMIKQGMFTSNDKIELLEGDLIKMSAVGPRHAACRPATRSRSRPLT